MHFLSPTTAIRLIACITMASIWSLALHNVASAQDARPSVLSESYDNWRVNCRDVGAAEDPTRVCELILELRQNGGTGQRILAIGIRHTDGENAMTIIAPLGIALAEGMKLELAETVAIQIPFVTCRPNGCFARSQLNTEMLEALGSEGEGKATLKALEGQTILIPFPLTGFSVAHQRLIELSE